MAYKQNPKSPIAKALVGNQHRLPRPLQDAIKAAPESPAKKEYGPDKSSYSGSSPSAGEELSNTLDPTQRVYAPGKKPDNVANMEKFAPAPKADKKAGGVKWDKELNDLVGQRKGLQKGTAAYNKVQNRINEKMGSSKRYRVEEPMNIKKKTVEVSTPKKPELVKTTPSAPSAPAKPKGNKGGGDSLTIKQNANISSVKTKTGGGANKGGATKKETVNKSTGVKKTVVKDKNTRTVTKTKKDGTTSTKTTKRIGKGRIKGAIADARLARLDKKADRQAAKAAKPTRKEKRADRLEAKASKLRGASSPAKQTMNSNSEKGRRDASGKLSVKQDPSKLKGKEKEEFIKAYAQPKKSPAKQTSTAQGGRASAPTNAQGGRRFATKSEKNAYVLGRSDASKGKKAGAVRGAFNKAQDKAYLQGMRDHHNSK